MSPTSQPPVRSLPGVIAAAAVLLVLGAPAEAQPSPLVDLSIASVPDDASVYLRYLSGDRDTAERYLGRTSAAPLQVRIAPGAAEVVVFKDGFLCKVEPVRLLPHVAARIEVRLIRDVAVPQGISLRNSPRLVEDAREGERLFLAVLGHVVRLFVDDQADPMALADAAVQTLVDVLNAVRRREQLLRRELEPEARQRYYGLELDLRAYPALEWVRGGADEQPRSFRLAAGVRELSGATEGDLDSHLAMIRRVHEFVRERWDVNGLLSDAVLTRCMIEGLLAGLEDEHTYLLGPDEIADLAGDRWGTFGGLGVVLARRGGHLTVVTAMAGTPAARAGILAGDIVEAIDGRRTAGVGVKRAMRALRGPIDTPVELSLRRGRRILNVEMIRSKIEARHTAHRMLAGGTVGYLRISSFIHEDLARSVEDALGELRAAGAAAIVLDLRNNGGGLLEQAHRVADMFLREGVVVSVRTRNAARSHVLSATDQRTDCDLPLAILINRGSASASEVLAGSLQEHGRAVLVGERSFGKGSVQKVLTLDPFRCALALTVATYHLPSGETPHRRGVSPDVLLPLAEQQALELLRWTNYTVETEALESDPQLQAAVAALKQRPR